MGFDKNLRFQRMGGPRPPSDIGLKGARHAFLFSSQIFDTPPKTVPLLPRADLLPRTGPSLAPSMPSRRSVVAHPHRELGTRSTHNRGQLHADQWCRGRHGQHHRNRLRIGSNRPMGVRPQPVGRPRRGHRPAGGKRNLLDRRGGARTRTVYWNPNALEGHPMGAAAGGLRGRVGGLPGPTCGLVRALGKGRGSGNVHGHPKLRRYHRRRRLPR